MVDTNPENYPNLVQVYRVRGSPSSAGASGSVLRVTMNSLMDNWNICCRILENYQNSEEKQKLAM